MKTQIAALAWATARALLRAELASRQKRRTRIRAAASKSVLYMYITLWISIYIYKCILLSADSPACLEVMNASEDVILLKEIIISFPR